MNGKQTRGDNVISLSSQELRRAIAPLRTVEAYWHALCDGQTVPERAQIDPRGIENALDCAFIGEKVTPAMIKFRVAGSHLSDVMGMATAGMPVSSLLDPLDRQPFAQAVERLLAEPAILRATLHSNASFGKPEVLGELLMMPLRSDLGDISRVLGCFVTVGQIGRAPRRFTLQSLEVTPLHEAGQAARFPESGPKVKTTGLAEPSRPFHAGRGRAALRLVVDNG